MVKKYQSGITNLFSLISVIFLFVALITATAVISNPKFKQDTRGIAAYCDSGNCYTDCFCRGNSSSECTATCQVPIPTPILIPVCSSAGASGSCSSLTCCSGLTKITGMYGYCQCSSAQACILNSTRCDGTGIQETCKGSGSGYDRKTCQYGCENGKCKDKPKSTPVPYYQSYIVPNPQPADIILGNVVVGFVQNIIGGINDIGTDANAIFGSYQNNSNTALQNYLMRNYLAADIATNVITLGGASLEDTRKAAMIWAQTNATANANGAPIYDPARIVSAVNAGATGVGLVSSIASILPGRLGINPQNMAGKPISSTYNYFDDLISAGKSTVIPSTVIPSTVIPSTVIPSGRGGSLSPQGLGKYGNEIGGGSFGTVYLDKKTNTLTKLFNPTTDFREIAANEAQLSLYEQYAGKAPFLTFKGRIPEGGFQQEYFSNAVSLDDFNSLNKSLTQAQVDEAVQNLAQLHTVTSQAHGDLVRPISPLIVNYQAGRFANIGYIHPENVLIQTLPSGEQKVIIIDIGGYYKLFTQPLTDPAVMQLELDTFRMGLQQFVK